MRLLEPRDMMRLRELHAEQNKRDGTSYPLPRMFGYRGHFDPDIVLALAIERRGELVQGVYFQSKMAEMCFAGCDAEATAQVKNEAEAVKYTLRSLGITKLLTHIPLGGPLAIESALVRAGFKSMRADFSTFFLDIEDLI
jgi:hypothetical protein